MHPSGVEALAVSRSRIVSGAGKAVYVYDAATEELLEQIDSVSDVTCISIHEGAGLIVAGYWDGTIKVWDAATLTLKGEKENSHSNWIKSVNFSPDGAKIVSGGNDKTIKVWDAGTRFSQLPPCTKMTS
eukprot:4396986-Prymnesium_polylepis.1